MSTFLNLVSRLDTTGGLNVQVGQTNLNNNESGNARNCEPLREGGAKKSPGLTLKKTFPREAQGFIVHHTPDYKFEILVYNYPFISRWNPETGSVENIKNSSGTTFLLSNYGNPRYETVGPERLTHIVDGKNNPMYYNGKIIQLVPWTFAYSNDNTDLFESSYTQAANPTEAGFPHDLVYVNNQMIYITPNDVGRAFFSLKGNTIDFWTNTYVGEVPINVAFFNDFPVTTPFTAVRKSPRGVIFYEMNGMSVMTGENPQIPGVSDTYQFRKVNDSYGVVSPHAVIELANNEHIGLSDQGVIQGGLSDNFDQLTPVDLSYSIQPLLDKVGRDELRRAKMVHIPNKQIVLIMLPRGAQYVVNSRLLKYYYGVGLKNKTVPWMQDEYFELDPTDFKDAVFDPSSGKTYFLINNKAYEWTGLSYDGNPIKMQWETSPNDYSLPGVNKYHSCYWLLYASETGGNLHLDDSWENFGGGDTTVSFPAKKTTQASKAILGVTKMQRRSALDEFGLRIPKNGSHIGKDQVILITHESEVEDLTLYNVFLEYEILGVAG